MFVHSRSHIVRSLARIAGLASIVCGTAVAAPSASSGGAIAHATFEVAPGALRTGILLDRVTSVSALERYDGDLGAPASTRALWSQMHFELTGAAQDAAPWAELGVIRAATRHTSDIPIAILDVVYERLQPGHGPDRRVDAADLVTRQAFAATALRETTYRGGACRFDFDPARYVSNRDGGLPALAVDFGDGLGFRAVRWGNSPVVHYTQVGPHRIRVRIGDAAGVRHASFDLEVAALGTPAPDDTLQITASIPYGGTAGSGAAYVYRAPGHAELVNPIVVIEGFDIDDSMGWDELYAILQQESLLETIRAQGFDAVVLDFAEATDPIQRNAFVVTELLAQVEATIAPSADIAVVGASMGGLVGRYALAYLETQATPARVRTLIAFDSPHRGANIPLGVQYWVQFFAGLSAEAALQRDLLNTAAARQMLAYHFTVPASSTPAPDPLRVQLLADFAAVGNYPQGPRLVAMANGSGNGTGQGFAPAAQVLRYEHDSFLVDIRGNIWAVPQGGPTMIFRGVVDYLIGTDLNSTVTVSGAIPYDNAPGGSRSSMADMDAIPAPYGDIVALHPNHCFIPTTSALDFATSDLFHDIAGDPNALAQTPFDAIYFASTNQPHVFIDAATAASLLTEVTPLPSSTEPQTQVVPRRLALHPAVPNPFNPSTRVRFELPRAGHAELVIYDVAGRAVTTLHRGWLPAGIHDASWDGRNAQATRVASGAYVCALQSDGETVSQRLVLLE